MTPNQSIARLAIYVAAAALTTVVGDYQSMRDADAFQWGGLIIKAALAGLVAGRAYIDKSPTEVTRP